MTNKEIAEIAAVIIFGNEGNYGSVNRDDNGAVSVGKLQWHADRAADLLRKIIKAEPEAKDILGNALYEEITGGATWAARTVIAVEAVKIKQILTSAIGQDTQDEQAITDVTAYIERGKSYGLTDPGALIYFADGVNQYGTGSTLWRTITAEALRGSGDVKAMHEATLNHTDKYIPRRKTVYEKVRALPLTGETEKELREKVINAAKAWLNCRESDGTHKQIIDLYNSVKPLPRGYKVKYNDAWCTTFVSAVAIKTELTEIIPRECGCDAMIQLFIKMGRWCENDAYVPDTGDVIFYDWQDTGIGDNTGTADHVGFVCEVSGGEIRVIEGNKNDAVGYRVIAVNGKYIRGYGLPDYGSISAKQPEEKEPEKPDTETDTYTVKKGDTLSQIARVYKTTVADLVRLNGIKDPNMIHVGQTLKLPGKLPNTYTVRRGDTLSRIAAAYKTTVADLVRLNSIKDPNMIRTGQILILR